MKLCFIGLHKWELVRPVSYYYRRWLVKKPALRKCEHCGKVQQLNEHCLGLNPPRYVREWVDANEKGYSQP